MVTEFKLPELGENIHSGDVTRVMVSAGDAVTKDQSLLELETEKVTIEVPSPMDGVIKEVHVRDGETVEVGQLILTLEGNGAGPAASKEEAEQPAREVSPAKKETAPEKPQPAADAVVEMRRTERPAVKQETPEAAAPAAPSVRRLARQLGVDINRVSGTGPAGRILQEDVERAARQLISGAPGGAVAPPMTGEPLPDFSRWGEVERRSMSGVRRATARHLSSAWTTIPHVTQHDKADITELERLRKHYAAKVEAAGGKLTVTAIVLKVLASALRVYPQFAASLDLAREEIIYKKYCHIGVAVDTDRGLLVPVIRDVDRKNIVELAVELNQVAERARGKKLTAEEMQGGVITVTNLGGIGGTYFSPIVNWPEVAILGLTRAAHEPVYREGQFVPRLMLPLSLSYDHRLIDGADAARFLRWGAEALEQPFLLSLEG